MKGRSTRITAIHRIGQSPISSQGKSLATALLTQRKMDATGRAGPLYMNMMKQDARFVESCDLCNKDYEAANKEYTNVVFIITAIFGIAAIFFGVYYKTEFIGVGFMFSGIILMFIGTMQNFDSLNRFLKPVVLLVELLLVLFIAYKKILNRDKTTYRCRNQS
jgi:VIT1/CCC1 family predicted Fe2+/Mn2+ transporter